MGNSLGGNYHATRENIMAAFDKLPQPVREALANAVENWVPQPVLTRLRRGDMTPAQMVAQIGRWNAQELAKRETKRARASGPYAGNVPDWKIARFRNAALRKVRAGRI